MTPVPARASTASRIRTSRERSWYDRSAAPAGRSAPTAPRLPLQPPAERCRRDALRDYDRLAAAFRTLIDEPMPPPTPPLMPPTAAPVAATAPAVAKAAGCGDPAGPSRSPASPRVFYEALDDAIAAASGMYDALCDWRDVGSSVDSPHAVATATAATATAAAGGYGDNPA